MSNVFISYAHEDAATAKGLADLLAELDIPCFQDVKDMGWGDPITPTVREALESCLALIVVLSKASLQSLWVPYEVGQAVAHRKLILPFVTDKSVALPHYLRDHLGVSSLEDAKNQLRRRLCDPHNGSEYIGGQTEREFRRMLFNGCVVPDEFLLKYGSLVLRDHAWAPLTKLRHAIHFRKTGILRVFPPHTYDVMRWLFEQVDEYWATATEPEIKDPASNEFIFRTPAHCPIDRVKRIFAISEVGFLRDLPADHHALLRQQLELGVKLRYLVLGRGESIENFGVYGGLACGKLGADGVNEVHFDPTSIHQARSRFRDLWTRAAEIDLGVLH